MEFYNNKNMLKSLISEYEAMSQKGTVGFYEKTVFLDLITYYENDHNFKCAIKVCDLAFSQHVSSIEFLLQKSRFLLDLENPEEAIECLDKALVFSPNNLEMHLLRVEAFIQLYEFAGANEMLKELYYQFRENDEAQAQILYLRTKIYEAKGQFDKMFFTLKKALQKSPNHPIILNKVWFSVEMSGLYEESVELHLEMIEHDPYSYLAWYNLGHAYFCLEKYLESAEAFEYVFIINKEFDLAYKDGAEAFLMNHNYAKALECYDEYLEVSEPDSDIYVKIGFCHRNLKDIETAKVYFLKAIDLNPCCSLAYFQMGECYMMQEKWDTAIYFYNQAIEMDCGKEEYLIAIAEAYFKNKNIQQAKEFFERATELAPELSKYWAQYAAFMMQMGDSEAAVSILEEAKNYSAGTELLYCKVACLFAMSKREEALQTLGEALQENASMLEALFTYSPGLEDDSEVRAIIKAFHQ